MWVKMLLIFISGGFGYFVGKMDEKMPWDQTTCYESRVMKYRHSYWYDTHVYCTKTLD